MSSIPTPDQNPISPTEQASLTRRHTAFITDISAELAQYNPPNNNSHPFAKKCRLRIHNITSRYTTYNRPISLYEPDIRELWYMLFGAARITSADHPAQDRLVAQVLFARGMGTVRRGVIVSDEREGEGGGRRGGEEKAVTRDGEMWTDLPFLVEELERVWEGWLGMGREERVNLCAFVARLVAVGIGGDGVCRVVVRGLKEVLEVERRVGSGEGDGDDGAGAGEVSIKELIPSVVPWFEYCGYMIEGFAIEGRSFSEEGEGISTAPGELAMKGGVVPTNGFSVARWGFWKERLEELSRCEDGEVAEVALRAFKMMKFWGERIEAMIGEKVTTSLGQGQTEGTWSGEGYTLQ
ncbi:hypothetical protein ACLMJK_006329 [Lecanora helva]